MKRVLLTLLGIILVVGVLAGAGFAGYRIGYRQAATVSKDGTKQPAPRNRDFGLQGTPMHNFGNNSDRDFNRGFGPGGFGMRSHGMRFGFFPPFMFLVHIAVWGLVIWLAFRLIKGSGWKISRTQQTVASPRAEVAAPADKPENDNG